MNSAQENGTEAIGIGDWQGPNGRGDNVAKDSTIGVQAQTVHGGVHTYHVRSDASPKERYEAGVHYLDGGVPGRARELIDEAVVLGHFTAEVCFHWLLAILSGRTLQELSDEDMRKLTAAHAKTSKMPEDQWTAGIRTIDELLSSLDRVDVNAEFAAVDLAHLGDVQRDKILRHMELFLAGPMRDYVWKLSVARARNLQVINERKARAWRFFHADPAQPRVRRPRPVAVSSARIQRAIIEAAIVVAIVGYSGGLILRRGESHSVGAFLLSIGTGFLAARTGLEWAFRVFRIAAKDREFQPRRIIHRPPVGGFADQVDQLFDRYFERYRPDKIREADWVENTAGIRKTLRDEVVQTYRESSVTADAIAWLIRYRVRETARLWNPEHQIGYRREFQTPVKTRVAFFLCAVVSVISGAWALGGAMRANPLLGSCATLSFLAVGWLALWDWPHIILERRRFAAEFAESQDRLAESYVELDRWRLKLGDKPTDAEMANWLDSDRKIFMDGAMRYYKLGPSDVIAHALLEVPADRYSRARVFGGPWRYSRYKLFAFLLTTDGVRQISADLDFANTTFHDPLRTNYRFDAVASVRVGRKGNRGEIFWLSLVSGEKIMVPVVEAGAGLDDLEVETEADARLAAEATLDAAGLAATLRVLEGIAAEGKDWVSREQRRGADRMRTLTAAVRGFVG